MQEPKGTQMLYQLQFVKVHRPRETRADSNRSNGTPANNQVQWVKKKMRQNMIIIIRYINKKKKEEP